MSLRFAILRTVRFRSNVRLLLSEAQKNAGIAEEASAIKEQHEIVLEYQPDEVIKRLTARTLDALGSDEVRVSSGVWPWRKERVRRRTFQKAEIAGAMEQAFFSMVKEFKHRTVALPQS